MKIRHATHTDDRFILEFLVRNARDHFNPVFLLKNFQAGLIEQFKRTINDGVCPMPDKEYPSSLQVAEIRGVPVGFMWNLQRTKNETEIYMVGVAVEHRKKGISEALLKNELSKFKSGHKVTSRVKRKSLAMKHILKKLGFAGKFYFPYRSQNFQLEIS
ncbi:hypothetical protein BTJ40_06310 [Microbulbifer sp. A4B17]|uniref:GNAT family N-acetyltransferase n=1 Tax=Microbulbifer sp. A4B17 TaxID=359370 RepID=UPI000D52E9AA|nr:GNAT family N-acetyltransferase [Microbulbifer sp. A4B17]AWF80456.1 hypothetical protein BTJ40_06310 [Microbulbifer sp. A4B17]